MNEDGDGEESQGNVLLEEIQNVNYDSKKLKKTSKQEKATVVEGC